MICLVFTFLCVTSLKASASIPWQQRGCCRYVILKHILMCAWCIWVWEVRLFVFHSEGQSSRASNTTRVLILIAFFVFVLLVVIRCLGPRWPLFLNWCREWSLLPLQFFPFIFIFSFLTIHVLPISLQADNSTIIEIARAWQLADRFGNWVRYPGMKDDLKVCTFHTCMHAQYADMMNRLQVLISKMFAWMHALFLRQSSAVARDLIKICILASHRSSRTWQTGDSREVA